MARNCSRCGKDLGKEYSGNVYCCPDTKPIEKTGLVHKGIAKLRKPEDSGLGDTLERLIAKFGGNKFKSIAKRLGINCGCEDRQKYLNEHYPYS